jgi:hypothetical protein
MNILPVILKFRTTACKKTATNKNFATMRDKFPSGK